MIPEFLRSYIGKWRRELRYSNKFTTFVVPLIAGAVATTAIKAAKSKKGKKAIKKMKRKMKR